jgi:hypothetical protein
VAPIKPLCLGRKEGELIKNLAGSCSLYYKCVDKKAVNETCSPGTTLDVKAQACVDSYNVAGCAPSKAIGECAPSPALSYTRVDLEKFCSLQTKNGLYADPATCMRGIVCVGNAHFYYTCTAPGRPFFSPTDGQCVGEISKCHLVAKKP